MQFAKQGLARADCHLPARSTRLVVHTWAANNAIKTGRGAGTTCCGPNRRFIIGSVTLPAPSFIHRIHPSVSWDRSVTKRVWSLVIDERWFADLWCFYYPVGWRFIVFRSAHVYLCCICYCIIYSGWRRYSRGVPRVHAKITFRVMAQSIMKWKFPDG